MLTIRTKVIEPGSLVDRIDGFIQILRNPGKIDWIKNSLFGLHNMKEESCISALKVDTYEPDSSRVIEDIEETSEVRKVTDEETRQIRYEFDYNGETKIAVNYQREHIMYLINDKEYVYIPERDFFLKVSYYNNRDGQFKMCGYKYLKNVIFNYKVYICYLVLKFLLDYLVIKPMRFIYTAMHTIDSIYLCIKYPFLYPRNRFTGQCYNNWKLLDRKSKLKSEAYRYLYVKYNEQTIAVNTDVFPLINFRELEKDKCEYYIYDNDGNEVTVMTYEMKSGERKNMTYFPIKINGRYHIYVEDESWWLDIQSSVNKDDDILKDGETETVHFYSMVKDQWSLYKANMIEWFHNKVLNFLFGIPTYNELDAMDEGWKRNFGIQMMDELKEQLKKENYLHKFRIMQIKEKFGGLRFYVSSASDEVYKIISKYENMSFDICLSCGKPAEYITTGWISPYCGDCISEDSKLRAKKIGEDDKDTDKEF